MAQLGVAKVLGEGIVALGRGTRSQDVDAAAAVRRAAARVAAALDHDDAHALLSRSYGSRETSHARAHDHEVGLVIPVRSRCGFVCGRDVGNGGHGGGCGPGGDERCASHALFHRMLLLTVRQQTPLSLRGASLYRLFWEVETLILGVADARNGRPCAEIGRDPCELRDIAKGFGPGARRRPCYHLRRHLRGRA